MRRVLSFLAILFVGFVVESPALAIMTPSVVPLPITFTPGEYRFTEQGRMAVEDLRQIVIEQGVKVIKLVGHTDSRGDRESNIRLSRERAEAVRDYLLAHGVTARIEVEGKGPDEPFDVSVLGRPVTQEEEWALDNRVEWVRDPETK